MFCPNCGKEIKDSDNFCRYCGVDLRIDEPQVINDTNDKNEKIQSYIENNSAEISEFDEEETSLADETSEEATEAEEAETETEEYVLYEVKKHWISLFFPAFLTPIFLTYFWNIFLNTHSILSWFVVIALLAFIIYPAMRFRADKFVITNKFAHIKTGLVNPAEFDIPLSKFDIFDIQQTSVGKMLDYGIISFYLNSEKYDYKYIDTPKYVKYIFEEPENFVRENL